MKFMNQNLGDFLSLKTEACNPTNAFGTDWYWLLHAQYIFPVVESFAGGGGGGEEMVFDDGTRQSVIWYQG